MYAQTPFWGILVLTLISFISLIGITLASVLDEEIIGQWPYKVLNLRTLMPALNNIECSVCTSSPTLLKSMASYITRLHLLITSGLMEQIKRGGKLQILDMSGIEFEGHQKLLMSYHHQYKTSTHVLRSLKAFHGPNMDEPGQSRILVMDLEVEIDKNRYKLVQSCMESVFPGLVVKYREITFYGIRNRHSILQILGGNTDHLMIESLGLQHCHLENSDYINAVLVSMQRLTNLRSIDLSYNLLKDTATISKIGTSFGKLANLSRLQLNCNYLTNKLSSILQHIQKPLISLDVSTCGLHEDDITFLANSGCTKELKELFLGYNDLSRNPDSLFKLLINCGLTLENISLEKASLGNIPSVANRLIQLSPNMKSLQKLNFKLNKIKVPDQAEIVSSFARHVPTLKIVQVPLVVTGNCDDVLRCMTIQTRDASWDTVNFNDAHLVQFVELCVRRLRDRQVGESQHEVHVLMTRGEYGDLYLANCCLLFQF